MANTQEKISLDLPPEKMPDWWQSLTDEEQYIYFRQMAIEYVKMNQVINEKKELSEESKKALNNSNEFLKKYNPFYPTWGMDFNLIGLFDSTLTADLILNVNFKKFFLKGRVFISPGFDIKVLKDFKYNETGVGGGFNFGFGFLL
jgi:hypothetical protein